MKGPAGIADGGMAHREALTAESVARAADQARIQAPALYRGRGPAVVELAWRAVFRLSVWAASPFHCNSQARNRTVVVDLVFPKMLCPAPRSPRAWFTSRCSLLAIRSGTWPARAERKVPFPQQDQLGRLRLHGL